MLNHSICPSIVVAQVCGLYLRKRSMQDSFPSWADCQFSPSYMVPIQGIKLCWPKPSQIFIYSNEAKVKHTGRILTFTWSHCNIEEYIFMSLKTDPLLIAKYRDLPILRAHVNFTIKSTYFTNASLNLIFKHNCSVSTSNRSCLWQVLRKLISSHSSHCFEQKFLRSLFIWINPCESCTKGLRSLTVISVKFHFSPQDSIVEKLFSQTLTS